MIGKDIRVAAKFLAEGQVVGIPTETVYGLAGNALREESVLRIFEVKNRPHFDPLIVHVRSVEEMQKYAVSIPDKLLMLARSCMPGPLTLLLQKKEIIPDLVTSGSARVALRIPAHPMTLALLNELDFPLAAPSANPFGYISPTTAKHVDNQLGDKIPYILDGGPCQVGLESTIAGMEDDRVVIYRKGGLEVEKIEQILGEKVLVKPHSSSKPEAPGMLTLHYAPRKQMVLADAHFDWGHAVAEKDVCYLRFKTYVPGLEKEKQRVLSPSGDIHEAARNLFRHMRELDELPCRVIFAESLPAEGLGLAINDRLGRASAGAFDKNRD